MANHHFIITFILLYLRHQRLEDINKRTVDINTNIISEVIDGEAKNLIDNLKVINLSLTLLFRLLLAIVV